MANIRRVVVLGVSTLILTLGTQACTLASDTYITSTQEKASTSANDAGNGSASSPSTSGGEKAGTGAACGTDDFVKPDLGALTACGDGKGHCFAKAKAPIGEMFVACDKAGEVCVPDEILEANGKPLKACTSIIGEGACLTASLIPEIEKQGGSALKQDTCDADQKCVPCVDPTNGGAATPFCKPIGVHENACSAAAPAADAAPKAALDTCCKTNGKSAGVCLVETAVPEADRESTPQDTCKGGDKCVPAAFVENKPVKCDGGIMGSGVCMDKCFNEMMGFAGSVGLLKTEGCGETEVCVPCRFLEGKGAPGCG